MNFIVKFVKESARRVKLQLCGSESRIIFCFTFIQKGILGNEIYSIRNSSPLGRPPVE
jgi:hypothetical protein